MRARVITRALTVPLWTTFSSVTTSSLERRITIFPLLSFFGVCILRMRLKISRTQYNYTPNYVEMVLGQLRLVTGPEELAWWRRVASDMRQEPHYLVCPPQSSSASRRTAAQLAFFDLIQSGERPER